MIVTARLQARLHPRRLTARISSVPLQAALDTGLRATLDPLTAELPLCAAPVFAPEPGVYYEYQTIILTSATPGAKIYYTTDGSDPTEKSTLFDGELRLRESLAVKARAYAPGYSPSEVVAGAYELIVSTPFITISADVPITTESAHSIACATPGSSIYFTTDGSDPTEDSTLYTVPFALPAGTYTIKARAYAPGYSPSDVAVSPEFTVQQSLPTEGGILHNGYIYHIFEADGELEVLADVDVEYLIVGGGGGGSNYAGSSGGGAGGLITNEGGDKLALLGGTIYNVTIGAGGAGKLTSTTRGNAGTDTTFSIKDGATLFRAKGGGGGGRYSSYTGGTGGSGGGAARLAGGVALQTIPATEGYDAGYGSNGGTSGDQALGSGGGGASGIPVNGVAGAGNQKGADGKQVFAGFKISSRSAEEFGDWYASGGGGHFDSDGGKGGGGRSTYAGADNGIDGSGSGGGACPLNLSGSGGSGIVIVRYAA